MSTDLTPIDSIRMDVDPRFDDGHEARAQAANAHRNRQYTQGRRIPVCGHTPNPYFDCWCVEAAEEDRTYFDDYFPGEP